MSLRQFVHTARHPSAPAVGEQEVSRRDLKRAANRLERRQDKAALRNLKGVRVR